MADTSPYMGLPLLTSGQGDPQVTHNEAIVLIQCILNGVIDKDLSTPPGSPNEGDCYIVGASATGAWAGQDDHLAVYYNGAWLFNPGNNDSGANLTIGSNNEGITVFVRDEKLTYIYTGSPLAWTPLYEAEAFARVLQADRTYYVDGTNGSDDNDGLSSGAGAFATIMKAVEVASVITIGAFTLTINVADDTYSENVVLGPTTGLVEIIGNTSTPGSCIISGGSTVCVLAAGCRLGMWIMRGFRTEGSGGGIDCNGGGLIFDQWDFANTGNHMLIRNTGALSIDTRSGSARSYEVSSGAPNHAFLNSGFLAIGSVTLDGNSGAYNFTTAFINAVNGSRVACGSMTFSNTGSITGKRHAATGNSVLNGPSGSATYFPGDVNGTEATGAVNV